jgi:cell division protein FtsW (lipid II flippase)
MERRILIGTAVVFAISLIWSIAAMSGLVPVTASAGLP